MKVNVDKVLERDAKLSELDNRAGRVLMAKLPSLPFLFVFIDSIVSLSS